MISQNLPNPRPLQTNTLHVVVTYLNLKQFQLKLELTVMIRIVPDTQRLFRFQNIMVCSELVLFGCTYLKYGSFGLNIGLKFFSICSPPGLLPVLWPREWYMTPTLDSALLCSSRAGTDLGRASDRFRSFVNWVSSIPNKSSPHAGFDPPFILKTPIYWMILTP